jgi:hypothetical protein
MRIFKVIAGILSFCSAIYAQPVVPSDREQLLKGDIADETLVADANGYPSPRIVLSLKDKIGLTLDQEKKINQLLENLSVSTSIKGREIVDEEEGLGKSFREGKINEKTLRLRLEAIGKMRADLRFVHLQIYIQMKQILSSNQWDKIKELQASEIK